MADGELRELRRVQLHDFRGHGRLAQTEAPRLNAGLWDPSHPRLLLHLFLVENPRNLRHPLRPIPTKELPLRRQHLGIIQAPYSNIPKAILGTFLEIELRIHHHYDYEVGLTPYSKI